MIRRALMLGLALVALLAAPAAAQADDYDGTTATATVQGDSIVVTGEGFIPGSAVRFSVEYGGSVVDSGTVTADAQGNVTVTTEVRGDGVYRITMTDGTNTAVATVTVGATGTGTGTAGSGGALPRTGDDTSVGLAQIGFAAVALGAVAVYGAKKRKAKAFV